MNIQEQLHYIEGDSKDPFIRAAAFTKIVIYLEDKLGKDFNLAHDILMRVHFKKSGKNYFLVESTDNGLEFSYNRQATSKELGEMVELLQAVKEKAEVDERVSEELKKKALELGKVKS